MCAIDASSTFILSIVSHDLLGHYFTKARLKEVFETKTVIYFVTERTSGVDLLDRLIIIILLYHFSSSIIIGAATARVARVRTLPTFGILTWDPPKFCSKVLIHYLLDPTIFSTPAAPLSIMCYTVTPPDSTDQRKPSQLPTKGS